MVDQGVLFPDRGRDDSLSPGKQPLRTTRRARNVRTLDQRTGRLRGASRAGMSPLSSVAIGTGPIQALATTVFDQEILDYAALGSPAIAVQKNVRSQRDAEDVQHDRFGNMYVIDGGVSIQILNASGETIDQVRPPLANGAVTRAFTVDNQRRLYVAPSEGGRLGGTRLYCYVDEGDDGYALLWELYLGAWVERIASRGARLFLLLNYLHLNTSYVVCLEKNGDSPPTEQWRTSVPAPGVSLDLNDSGDIFVGSETNALRGLNPAFPGLLPAVDDAYASWKEDALSSYATRRWTVFDPATLELNKGDPVLEWADEQSARRLFNDGRTVNIRLSATRVIIVGGNVSDGDTLEVSTEDGEVVERWTFRTAISVDYDVLIGGSLGASAGNLRAVMNAGGDGTNATNNTPPSALVNVDTVSGGAFRCFCTATQLRVVVRSTGTNLHAGTGPNGSFTNEVAVRSERIVQTKPAAFLPRGTAGWPCLSFNGLDSLMLTEPNKSRANAAGQTTLIPGYGDQTLGGSARYAFFFVIAPAQTPWISSALSHSSADIRRPLVVLQSNVATPTAGAQITPGALNVQVRTGASVVDTWGSNIDRGGPQGICIVEIVSTPTGTVEVFINGRPIGRTEQSFTAATWLERQPRRITAASGTPFNNSPARVIVTAGTNVVTGVYAVSSSTATTANLTTSLLPPSSAITGGIAFANAGFNVATLALTVGVSTFTGAETHVYVASGTDVVPGYYDIASHFDAFTVFLTTDITASATSPTNVGGTALVVSVSGLSVASQGTAFQADCLGRTSLGRPEFGSNYDFWKGELLYVLSLHHINAAAVNEQERQLVEARLAWRFGVATTLPANHPFRNAPPDDVGATSFQLARRSISPFEAATKLLRLTGEVQWLVASDGTAANPTGALASLVVRGDGSVYSSGRPAVPATDPAQVRLIVDAGETFSLGWSANLHVLSAVDEQLNHSRRRLAVDEFNSLYVPVQIDGRRGVPPSVRIYSSAGALLATLAIDAFAGRAVSVPPHQPDGATTGLTVPERVALVGRRGYTLVGTMSAQPTTGTTVEFVGLRFGTPFTTLVQFQTSPSSPEHVQIGANVQATLANMVTVLNALNASADPVGPGSAYAVGSTATTITVSTREAGASMTVIAGPATNLTFSAPQPTFAIFLLDFISKTVSTRTRQHALIAVCDGNVKQVLPSSAPTLTGGAGALSATSRYVQAAALLGKVFLVDGNTAKFVDMRELTVQDWVPEGRGFVPKTCRIVEPYLGGIFLAADESDSDNWFLTGRPRPFDFDYSPAVPTVNQAVDGSLSLAGRVPDSITGFASIFDDIAIVLCDHTIWRLTGDPAANGRFDLISGSVGGAFGRAWAQAPDGALFFWSPQIGLCMTDGTRVQPISRTRLDRAFQDVDLTKFFIRLAWNHRYDGLDIMVCPFNGVAESPITFFWERSVDAFWEDDRSVSSRDVTDILVVDGDLPDDRVMALGCRDGRVRRWDETALGDDAVPINSNVLIGPISGGNSRYETMLSRLQILLEQTGGRVQVRLFTSNTPDGIGSLVYHRTVYPGLTPEVPVRIRGGYVWLEVASQDPWAYEDIRASLQFGSYRRMRT